LFNFLWKVIQYLITLTPRCTLIHPTHWGLSNDTKCTMGAPLFRRSQVTNKTNKQPKWRDTVAFWSWLNGELVTQLIWRLFMIQYFPHLKSKHYKTIFSPSTFKQYQKCTPISFFNINKLPSLIDRLQPLIYRN
jgi:hypothetical protein